MANAFIVYPDYPLPELSPGRNIDRVVQVEPYRRYERSRDKDKDKKRDSFSKMLEKEIKDKRWETGNVSTVTEIGDPGFFFDYKM